MNSHFKRKVVWAGCKLARQELVTEQDLPWRQYSTPYRVFLAELLLVRTRVDVVARIFENVFDRYPNIEALAVATEDELEQMLHPLGLRKRTTFIIGAAQYILATHDGEIPSDIDALLKTPGLGVYTSSAIAVFAYGQNLVPGDVNILRFISRLTGLDMEHKTKGSDQLRELAPCLSMSRTGLSSEKLLDFSRLTCRPRKPSCNVCPLTRFCVFAQARSL